ncbi:MAG: hypothetical protein EP344_12925 [Bacteroidetes bacterium]|nr:MAG: hypothetical protein EP344_12925 [Bacteroidota bacterium]
MKKATLLVLFLLAGLTARAQPDETIKLVTDFFPEAKTQVLVVGTFHFDYPNLDVYKTVESDQIDVLQEPKKSEVTELVNYIKNFRPTKIAIEAFPEWKAGEKLREYKAGAHRDKRDERYQLAFRIADELNLDTVYSIDSWSFDDELAKLDTAFFKAFYDGFDFQSDDPFEARFRTLLGYEDKLPARMSLLDYFKRINARDSHQLGYGVYLVGDFKLDGHRGADILSVWWYNRNLRIFRKLQDITEGPNDRILLVFGNGHAAILRQLLECSPEYEFVEFESLK